MERPFEFRTPVILEESAVFELCRLARQGYETRNKRETFGFLYGILDADQHIVIRHARYFRGGVKTRYGVQLSYETTRRRRRELGRELRLRFLGSFHSHVEVAGEITRGMSETDRASLRDDEQAVLEAVVFVWAGLSRTLRPAPRSVVGYEPDTGYHYRIRVYAKHRNGIRKTRVRVRRSGVVIIY